MFSWLALAMLPAVVLRRLLRKHGALSFAAPKIPNVVPLAAAVVAQFVLVYGFTGPMGAVTTVASSIPVVVAGVWIYRFAAANAISRSWWFPSLAVGIGANTAVIAANGFMPVSIEAEAKIHGVDKRFLHFSTGKHGALTEETRLNFLADTILTPQLFEHFLPAMILSPGDLLMMLGYAGLVFSYPPRSGDPVKRHRSISPQRT